MTVGSWGKIFFARVSLHAPHGLNRIDTVLGELLFHKGIVKGRGEDDCKSIAVDKKNHPIKATYASGFPGDVVSERSGAALENKEVLLTKVGGDFVHNKGKIHL